MIKYYFVACGLFPQEGGAPFNLVKILEIDNECFLSCLNEEQTKIGLLDDFENDEAIIESLFQNEAITTLHQVNEEKYNELKKFLNIK